MRVRGPRWEPEGPAPSLPAAARGRSGLGTAGAAPCGRSARGRWSDPRPRAAILAVHLLTAKAWLCLRDRRGRCWGRVPTRGGFWSGAGAAVPWPGGCLNLQASEPFPSNRCLGLFGLLGALLSGLASGIRGPGRRRVGWGSQSALLPGGRALIPA